MRSVQIKVKIFVSHASKIPDYIECFNAVVGDNKVDINTVCRYSVTFTVSDNIVNSLTNEQLIKLYNVETSDEDGISSILVDNSEVDYNKPGKYHTYVTATDNYGVVGERHHAILSIVDVLPQITKEKRLVFSHAGDGLDLVSEFGITASEPRTGDLTSEVTVDDCAVNYNNSGPYKIVFSIKDEEDNIQRTSGLLVMTNDTSQINASDSAQTPEGLKLSDQDLLHLFDVKITDQDNIKSVSVDTSDINFEKPGTYYIGFLVTDEFGKVSSSEYAQLDVLDTKPKITVSNDVISIHVGQVIDYLEAFGTSASEIISDDLTGLIKVDSSKVDITQPGVYPVQFSVHDNDGNITELTVSVKVTNDVPIIDIKSAVTVLEESSYSQEQLIQLLDLKISDKDEISSVVIDDSSVDYNTPGEYSINVTATDSYNSTSTKTANVDVKDVVPTLEVTHDKVEISLGDSIDIVDSFGVSATEFESGDLTEEVIIDDSKVDYNKRGTYPIVLSVNDDDNNLIQKQVKLKINNSIVNNLGNDRNSPTKTEAQFDNSIELSSTGSKLLSILLIILFALLIIRVIFLLKERLK